MLEGTGLSIRFKTISILIVSFLALVVVLSIVLHTLVTPKFEELEEVEVQASIDRFVNELEDSAGELRSRAADWGGWDDTYQFLIGGNPDYVKSNLSIDSIANLNVDLLIILDVNGKVVQKVGVDVFFTEELPVSPEVLVALRESRMWEKFGELNSRAGIIATPHEALIFGAHKILRSDMSGPSVGTLIVGRFINHDFLEKSRKKLSHAIFVKKFDGEEFAARISGRAPKRYHGLNVYSFPLDEKTISGFATISDWEGKPTLVVDVRKDRDIYESGLNAIIQAVLAMMLLGVAFMALVIFTIDRIALARLSMMTEAIAANKSDEISFWDESGDEIAMLASTIETAFREKAERSREVEISERRKELALSGADLGFWEYNLETGEFYFSARFCTMLGFEPGEIEATFASVENLIHPDDRATATESLGRVIADPSSQWDIDYRLLHKDGDYRHIHSRGRVVRFSPDGKPVLLSGTHMDVTERAKERERQAQLEEKLRSAEKLKAVGTLAGGVAHNFNNILAAIMGYAELVQEDLQRGSLAYRNVTEILEASSRASELVRQLLVFSQDGGHEKETVDARRLIIETFKFMREVIPTSVDMVHRVPDLPLMVKCDTQAMRQAFINICYNAREALKDDRGRITITVEAKKDFSEAWETEGRDVALITFTDDGCGMEPEIAQRVFEPYFTTKGDADRLGLGLSLAHGAVTDCGGTIALISRVGEGTTVRIALPVAIGDAEIRQLDHKALTGGEHILFVDDERLLVDIATQHFGRLGYRITALTDPGKALERFLSDPSAFNAVISDYSMPGCNGVELAALIKAARPDIPIFLCSGYIDVVSDDAKEAVGIREIFRKPLSFDYMLTRVRKELDDEAQRSAS